MLRWGVFAAARTAQAIGALNLFGQNAGELSADNVDR